MREDYLHHLFQMKRLGNSFRTTSGEIIQVQKFGQLNPNAGPDFLDSKIVLKDTTWAGSIEFHVKSSDWFLHGHQTDERYKNVIAHFVFEHDREVEINGQKIPTVELKEKIDWEHYRRFKNLADSQKPISCATQLNQVNPLFIYEQKQRALINRLMRKSDRMLVDLQRLNGDREKVFYLALARIFGGKVNADAFESLTEKLHLSTLRKISENELSVPAILFGLSGMLPEDSENSYVCQLIREFKFQKHRLDLKPMHAAEFRFSRMHPPGFPTVRLAQLAEVLRADLPLGSLMDAEADFYRIRQAFTVSMPEFWNNHYRFEKEVKKHPAQISEGFIALIVINVLAPFLFASGRLADDEALKEKALRFLTETAAETNGIIHSWKGLGIESSNAFDTQALIEQKNEFCSKKKCLFCSIGNQLLKA
jgi:hypothetical protein